VCDHSCTSGDRSMLTDQRKRMFFCICCRFKCWFRSLPKSTDFENGPSLILIENFSQIRLYLLVWSCFQIYRQITKRRPLITQLSWRTNGVSSSVTGAAVYSITAMPPNRQNGWRYQGYLLLGMRRNGMNLWRPGQLVDDHDVDELLYRAAGCWSCFYFRGIDRVWLLTNDG